MKTYIVEIHIKELESKKDGTKQTERRIFSEQIVNSDFQKMYLSIHESLGKLYGQFILGDFNK